MKNKSGYFISIGGGANQLPLIEKVASLGNQVVTIDKNELAPGFAYSRVKILESTNEYRKVLSSLSQVPLTDRLVGIGCRSYGKASYTTAYIAEKLNLPGSPPNSIRLFLNKLDYLTKLRDLGVPIPKIIEWTSKANLLKVSQESNFPLILKPIVGSGKAKIEFFHTYAELKSRVDKNYPSPGEFFLQEYIHGEEITVMGMVDKENFHFISASDKITTQESPFVEIAHIVPSRHMDLLSEINVYMKIMAKFFKLSHVPFLGEFKIDENSNIFLMEAVPEVGGEYLAESLIPNFLKYDYFKELFRLLVNEFQGGTIPDYHQAKGSAVIFFAVPNEKESAIVSIDKFTPLEGETLFLEKDLKTEGDSVRFSQGNICRAKVVGLLRTTNSGREEWLEDIKKRIGVVFR